MSSPNKFYIEKYKNFDKILSAFYLIEDQGRIVTLDNIINPLKIDNRQITAVTDNQFQTSHCAGYSICNIFEAYYWKMTGKLINLNADQVYAKAKLIDGSVDEEGTYLECAIKACWQLCKFDGQPDLKFLYNNKTSYVTEMIKFLVHKYDFVHCGFNITSGWYNCDNTNYVIDSSGNPLGGHAVIICGYDDVGVYIQNSWG